MTYLSEKVRVIALEILMESLEDGEDAREVAARLRTEIASGWNQALDDSGMPAEMRQKLTI